MMTVPMLRRLSALFIALAVLLSGATSAQAQRSRQDVQREAELAARAAQEAKKLREEEKKGLAKPLVAVVPLDPANVWVLDLSNGMRVRIQLRPDIAPGHVERIKTLTRQKFYDGLLFHRVIEGFMAQGGDPKGDGSGGSTLPDLKQEFSWMPHLRGTVSMARAESEDSANSQFFIMFMPRSQLDHKYTVFGRVIDGMAAVDAIAKGEPPQVPTRIVRASIEGDGTAPPTL